LGGTELLRDVLTEAELRMLLGEEEAAAAPGDSAWDEQDRKLLHALVRNQLRLLHMIEDMQSELRLLKAAASGGRPDKETVWKLEPLPLPFMSQAGGAFEHAASGQEADGEKQKAPAAEVSRKERHKRKSFW